MSKKLQQAIAKEQGWKYDGDWYDPRDRCNVGDETLLPDYCGDVNVMRKVIASQDEETIGMIQIELMDVLQEEAKKRKKIYWVYLATANQLAKAYARYKKISTTN